MFNLTIQSPIPLPEPRVPISIRAAVLDDVAFIDGLQKKQSKQVGFFPRKALEGKISLGHVLVAEEVGSRECGVGREGRRSAFQLPTPDSQLPTFAGYLIGNDQYFKRDDVGCIFQVNVVPEYRRSLVAAALLKAQFERSAYGCRLYCCWCAQDIEANRFWEAMGFVPLAFRSGGKARSLQRAAGSEDGPPKAAGCKLQARVHIFWQKRIRAGDVTTPWWYPSTTSGGSIRGQRLVFPIPPGVHWSDPMPTVLPGETGSGELGAGSCQEKKALPAPRSRRRREPAEADHPKPQVEDRKAAPIVRAGRLQFFNSAPAARVEAKSVAPVVVPVAKTPKPPREKPKYDPKHLKMARELRDRYLEQCNDATMTLPAGKYDLGKQIEQTVMTEMGSRALEMPSAKLLPAA